MRVSSHAERNMFAVMRDLFFFDCMMRYARCVMMMRRECELAPLERPPERCGDFLEAQDDAELRALCMPS